MLVIFFLNLLPFSSGLQCQCGQLLSEKDCNSLGCEWKQTYCVQKTTRLLEVILKEPLQYCDLFVGLECLNQPMCAWRNDKCEFFSGCTAYNYTTDVECTKISLRCFSDGTHCVEYGKCSEYKQQACIVQKNQAYKQSQICAWIDEAQLCQDPTTCDQIKLPPHEHSDERCRQVLAHCSYKEEDFGCIESGINCTDQISRDACKWNRAKTQRCAWIDKCVDRICSNAPVYYTTDKLCRSFVETQECSLNPKGGCVKKNTCSSILVEEGCTYDIENRSCKWINKMCIDFVCKNAPQTLTTNKQCDEFLSGCITNGNGCVDNGECEAAIVKQACIKNTKGQDCFWDIICRTKACSDAPKILTTNDECDSYLSNCVTKEGGGCMQNLKCTDITFRNACEENSKLCFWDDDKCKDLNCINAPEQFYTHELCQQFMNTCTVNSMNNGCVVYTCQNNLTQDTCKFDYEMKPCTYYTKCQEVACSRASKTFITHEQCQQYDSSCTLSNNGFGCMTIPLICSAITIDAACYLRKTQDGFSKCGWNGQFCQDLTCSTIPKNIKWTMDCSNYLTGCVASNPEGGVVEGCMDLPKNCSQRLTTDNCEIIQGDIKCLWDYSNMYCREQNCESASVDGVYDISDYNCSIYCIQQLSSIDCITNGCTSNNTGDGCMQMKNNCFEYYTSDNCKRAKNNQKCYWDENFQQCYKFSCQIIYRNGLGHDQCQGYSSQCTINSIGDRCQDLTDCSQYSTMQQCIINKNQEYCVWDQNQYCRNNECTDYIYAASDTECSNNNQNCTVNVKSLYGCTNRKQCTDYVYKEQCVKDFNDLDCIWINSQCQDLHDFQCSSIMMNVYDNVNCQDINFTCKANDSYSGCIEKNCEDYTLTKDGTQITTIEQCQSLNITCTYNKENRCQVRFNLCQYYTDEQSCTVAREGKCFYNGSCQSVKQDCSNLVVNNDGECEQLRPFCQNNGSYQCSNKSCNSMQGSNISFQDCQNYDQSCSTKSNKLQCYDIQLYCYDYGQLDFTICVRSQQGWCYVDQDYCQDFQPDRCNLIQNQNLSDQECQMYHSNCILNNSGDACQNINAYCENYDYISCTRSNEGECVFNNPDYQSQNCILVSPDQPCDRIYLGFNNYTHLKCNTKNSNCTNTGTSGCTNKTCQNAITQNSFEECNAWLNTCTFNQINNCVTISQYCNQQSQWQCYYSLEGECTVVNDQCVKKTCDTAPVTDDFSNHQQCTQYLSSCTTVGQGGCVSRQPNCMLYQSKIQCVKDLTGQKCYWSTLHNKCLILKCENIDSTVIYNNHTQCENTLSSCTVKSNSYGCQNKSSCSSYQSSNQCVVNNQGKYCVWFTNLEGESFCVDKSCYSAPLFYKSYSDCYLFSQGENYQCTVKVINSEIKGCQELQVCEKYQYIQECLIDLNGKECVWKGVCLTKSCETDDTYQCSDYPDCIISNNGSGCMKIQEQCEFHYYNQNCIRDIKGNLCVWNEKFGICQQRTCQNAPDTIQDDSACRNYQQGCMMNESECQDQVCEDFYYDTDFACQQAMKGCTTDGRRCVQSGLSCELRFTEVSCTYDANLNQCQWVTNSKYPYCTLRTCKTAPKEYKSEETCQVYLSDCTTTLGGGCVLKTICQAATVKAACTTDKDGQTCTWDDDKQLCRYIECSDFFGMTYEECMYKGQNCTVGYNGKCAKMKICSEIKLNRACIKGLDGPCIWVFDYKNSDKTYGACFAYDSCKSFQWKSHSECSKISNECTTDGNQCVAITRCEEITTKQGCFKGYNGDCVWTQIDQGTYQCQQFTNCNQFKYITHEECYKANKQCTTDGRSACQNRQDCNRYQNSESCNINSQGVQKDNGTIISTGNCIWGDDNKCRDETCSDIFGRSHEECNQILSNCTYDGVKCMKHDICKVYDTQQKCENAKNLTNEPCQWNGQNCSNIVCVHIPNGNTMAACQTVSSNCISNGSFCIAKSKCTDYPTKIACEFGGTDSKYCIFTNNKCQIDYCQQYWKSNNPSCPKQIIIGEEEIFCQQEGKECKLIDPELLNQADCFSQSVQTYTFSTRANKCIKCSSVKNTEQPITVSSLVECLTLTLLIYLVV